MPLGSFFKTRSRDNLPLVPTAARMQRKPAGLNRQQAVALEPVLLDRPKELNSVPRMAALLQQDSLAEAMHLWVREGTVLQKGGKQRPQKREQYLNLLYTALVAEVRSPMTNEEAKLVNFRVTWGETVRNRRGKGKIQAKPKGRGSPTP